MEQHSEKQSPPLSIDRWSSIVWMATNARAIIAVEWAKALANGMGMPFARLWDIDPRMVSSGRPREGSSAAIRRKGWAVEKGHMEDALVQVSDLAAAMCRYAGLYQNDDQAKQSQHATPGREAQYVCQRACVRLAFHFFGKGGHTDRYGDDPAVQRLVSEVPSIKVAGQRHYLKDPVTHQKVLRYDGTPVLWGGDQILIEKIYKPQTIEGAHV